MEPNILSIRCTYCGAILKVRNQAGIEQLSVACPNCHEKFNVGEGLRNLQRPRPATSESEDTVYAARRMYVSQSDETTLFGHGQPLGHLVEVATGKTHPLKAGVNTIGRSSQSRTVSIAIDDSTRKMSREHAIIEVNQMPDGAYRHFLRNWNNQNKTYVDNEILESGECIVLQNGQILRMGSVFLRFVLPDDEHTVL